MLYLFLVLYVFHELNNVCQGKDSHQPSNGNHWWLWQKNSKQLIAILGLGWLLYEGHHGLFCLACLHQSTPSSAFLSALAPILLNYEVPPLKVVVICLVGGETMLETSCWRVQSSFSLSVNFAALIAVAKSWVVLLDLDILPYVVIQLSLGPGHLGHELALVCHDYLWGWQRYCTCNTCVWWSCHIFYLVVWLDVHFQYGRWGSGPLM